MFYDCSNITEIDLSNFDTSKVEKMDYMFHGCSSLTSLDLTNFETSKVTTMDYMFQKCSSLNTLDLSYFNTSLVTSMAYMFSECSSLVSLNLSNFKTSSVVFMFFMFSECSSLISLDLSNFDTSQVISMNSLFLNCSSLVSMDLSSFNTNKVFNMKSMFNGCSSLVSLNLSNFDASELYSMDNMFYGCSSLSYLDLSNFEASNTDNMDDLFYGCSNLQYLNLKSGYLKKDELKNLITSNIMICSQNEEYQKLFTQKQYINCISNNITYDNNLDNNCYSNNSMSINNRYICGICGKDYFQINNSGNNNNISYINCYESPEGYYLDEKDYIYKLCYNSCRICDKIGDETQHNCIKCNEDYIYEISILNNKNCYTNIPDIITDSNELITDLKQKTKNSTEIIKDIIIENIFKNLNITEIDNGIDKKIKEKNLIIILTSTLNQKIKEDKNNITMNLGKCETLLKNNYNISNNDSLYILQIISEEVGMKIPKIEYEIYYPLYNNNNLTKLNLSSCEDSKIEISISVKINDTLDKYNSKSEYYNNICHKTTSESGTDISLKDRRKEFVVNNMSLCEENCELIGYNYNKEKVKCSCDIKLTIPENYDIKFNKRDFYKSFTDIKKIANLDIIKCYETVLKFKSLIKNYGFFFLFFILIFYIITFFVFWFISYIKLRRDCEIIFSVLNKNEEIKVEQITKTKIKNQQKGKKKNKKYKENNIKKNNKINAAKNSSIGNNKKNNHHKEDKSKQITLNNDDNSIKTLNKNNKVAFNLAELNNINDKYTRELLEQKDFELNSSDYEEALKSDKRSFGDYYISLIRNNHPLFFSFSTRKDYNSPIVKIILFFFSLCLDFTINALFFTDETMHKIYEDKGKYSFLYQIPQILYSALISKFIDSIIRRLALSQDNIVEFKQEKEKANIKLKYFKLLRIMKIKFVSFYIISFIILVFFWYYVICFCGIYVNTQIHLIKDSFFSLLTGLFYPFVICVIPVIFRIPALRVDKPTRGFLYKFSSLLESLLC